jgi:hypothetical protein
MSTIYRINNQCLEKSDYVVEDRETAAMVRDFFTDTDTGSIYLGGQAQAEYILKNNQYAYLLQENYRFPVNKIITDVYGNSAVIHVHLADETVELAAGCVFRVYDPTINDYIEAVGLEAAIEVRYAAQMKFLETVGMGKYSKFDSNYIIRNQQQVNSN